MLAELESQREKRTEFAPTQVRAAQNCPSREEILYMGTWRLGFHGVIHFPMANRHRYQSSTRNLYYKVKIQSQGNTLTSDSSQGMKQIHQGRCKENHVYRGLQNVVVFFRHRRKPISLWSHRVSFLLKDQFCSLKFSFLSSMLFKAG